MIKHPFSFIKKGLKVEFNYHPNVIPCKIVRITLGKKTIELSREDFTTLMAVFANDQQLEDIMQITKSDFVSIERMLKLKTNKDLKAGEYITFPYTYWIQRKDYEQMKADGDMVKLVEESKKGLIDYIADNEAAKEVKQIMLNNKITLDAN